MGAPIVTANVLFLFLWQMELPCLADVIAIVKDSIAIYIYIYIYTPEEAMSGGLAKACVPSKN